SVREAFLLT
nr:immunoglobulin heavy chain junction region [Mus musculus]